MNIKIKTKNIVSTCVAIIVVLFLFNAVCYYLKFVVKYPNIRNFVLINLDEEANFPTYFSSLLLLISGVFLGIISLEEKQANSKFFHYWAFLSIIFFSLSLDEAASIHELSSHPLQKMFGFDGLFYHAWVVPGILLICFLAIIYIRFLMILPSKTKILFVVSASLYIGGAVGMEIVGGKYASLNGQENFIYGVVTMIEETMEMVGIVLFIYALLNYIRTHIKRVSVEFE